MDKWCRICKRHFALKYCAYKNNLEIVKYFIIDCRMEIKEKTLEYLQKNKYLETLHIIKIRDLYNKLDDNLNNSIINDKDKVKI
jgi:hypothetical protein